jgi:uncharacterized protein HemX
MNQTKLIIGIIIILVLGLGAGYYFGQRTGIIVGREQVLDEQKKAQEEALQKVAAEANPFAEIENKANPFKDAYKNPFAQ